jgi:hypothetical protein
MALDGVGAELTFNDYPIGTYITNQYQDLGIVFSGDPSPPRIFPPSYFGYFGSDDPALFCNQFGSTTLTFVEPISGTLLEATNFHINPYYILYGGSVIFTFYGIDGDIVSQQEAHNITFQLYSPLSFHRLEIVPITSGPIYVWFDNVSFQFGLIIKQPKEDDVYPLNQNNYTETGDIPFRAISPGTNELNALRADN